MSLSVAENVLQLSALSSLNLVQDQHAKHCWLLDKLKEAQLDLEVGSYREISCQYPDGRKRVYWIYKDETAGIQAWRIHDRISLNEAKGESSKGAVNKIAHGSFTTVFRSNSYTLQNDSYVKRKNRALSIDDPKDGVTSPNSPQDDRIKAMLKALGLTERGMALRHIHGSDLVGEFYEDDLFEYFSKNGHFSSQQLRSVLPDLLEALVSMHEIGYLHLDIKAENILIRTDEQGELKAAFCDFDGLFEKITRFKGSPGNVTVQDYELWLKPKGENLEYTFEDYHKQRDIVAMGFVMLDMACGDWKRSKDHVDGHALVDLDIYRGRAQFVLTSKRKNIPKQLQQLIQEMLKPNYNARPTAKEVQARFMAIQWE